jgi:hypothetical protein
MADEPTPDNATEDVSDPNVEIPPGQTEGKGFNKDWIPAIGLGVVLLSLLVFAGGFLVGRAAADDADGDLDEQVIVQVERYDDLPRGFEFEDFYRRGPQGRFDGPRFELFEDFEVFPEAALDRLCGFLEDEAIPNDAPFIDRLLEVCTNDEA